MYTWKVKTFIQDGYSNFKYNISHRCYFPDDLLLLCYAVGLLQEQCCLFLNALTKSHRSIYLCHCMYPRCHCPLSLPNLQSPQAICAQTHFILRTLDSFYLRQAQETSDVFVWALNQWAIEDLLNFLLHENFIIQLCRCKLLTNGR